MILAFADDSTVVAVDGISEATAALKREYRLPAASTAPSPPFAAKNSPFARECQVHVGAKLILRQFLTPCARSGSMDSQ